MLYLRIITTLSLISMMNARSNSEITLRCFVVTFVDNDYDCNIALTDFFLLEKLCLPAGCAEVPSWMSSLMNAKSFALGYQSNTRTPTSPITDNC